MVAESFCLVPRFMTFQLRDLLGFSTKCTLYLFFLIIILASTVVRAETVFSVEPEQLATIPHDHLTFLEGFDHTAHLSDLEDGAWLPSLQSDQSLVDGYWARVRIFNNTNTQEIGINHNWNREKKIFTVSRQGAKSYPYWVYESGDWIDDGRILGQYKVLMPVGEETVLYSYFRSRPFDRFMGRVNGLDRMTVGSWQDVQLRELFRFASNIVFMSVAFAFGLYYFFIYLVSKGNYLWLSLSLFQATIIVCLTSSNAMLLGIDRWVSNSEFSLVLNSGLFALLLQFFRKSLELDSRYKRFDKIYFSVIVFYIVMAGINFVTSLSWPGPSEFDLVAYPPDRLGPGIVKLQYLFLPFALLLFTSVGISAFSWHKGSKTGKYMCVSFMLPLLTAPISIIAFLLYGFTWITMLVATTFGGLLFLSMFITFGFAVAQQLNDLKALALDQQIRLTTAYQRFVPKQLLLNLKKDSILDVHLGDQVEIEMSILFSDIRSFTSISESMTPDENFRFVNGYLKRMGPIVRGHNGYIDKFLGDGIMALFTRAADDATSAAVKMQQDLIVYNEDAKAQGAQSIDIGIGVNTGSMMFGTLGEADRMEGSVISDAVNLAARLEMLTKLYQAKVLISEDTYLKLTPDIFAVRMIDKVAVKGKSEAVKVFEVLDADSDDNRALKVKDKARFDEAVTLYQAQNINEALTLFTAIYDNNPADMVVCLYIERCKSLLKDGWDTASWDGVNRMQTK